MSPEITAEQLAHVMIDHGGDVSGSNYHVLQLPLVEAGKVLVTQSMARENAPGEAGQRIPALDGSFPTREYHDR
ncbi:MAG: hypothetical protein M9924_21260 [Rhizobiaceae bacterium]|nr:hypothetical protein [Rhizobiaceae bacterium]